MKHSQLLVLLATAFALVTLVVNINFISVTNNGSNDAKNQLLQKPPGISISGAKQHFTVAKQEVTTDEEEHTKNDKDSNNKKEEEDDDDDDDDTHGLSVSEELEFFVTQDESIQRLEEVEGLFRNNVAPDVRNNNFGVAVVATQKKQTERKPPERFGAVKMTDNNGIGVDQDSPSKKLIYYQYEGTLSKIRRNLYNNPYNEYSE